MKTILRMLPVFFLFAGTADAKWWIFGKSGADVEIKFLNINGVSADEAGPKITLFRETLRDGKIEVRGRAAAGRNRIGSVRLSLDDRATWREAKVSEKGHFEYDFAPEPGRAYVLLVEATDTTGKTNKVEETRREIALSSEDLRSKAAAELDALFDAYAREDLSRFMARVSRNFAGDEAFLEVALKKDFSALNDISLRYTINGLAAGAGRLFVSITFQRRVVVGKTGQMNTDSGVTEFVFETDGGRLALYSMKQPLVFGLSDAENVATGQVPGNSGVTLVLDDSGNLGAASETVGITCSGTGNALHPVYYFSTGDTGCHPQTDVIDGGAIGELILYGAAPQGELQHNGQVKEINKPLSSLSSTEVRDLAGYSQPVFFPITLGRSYAIFILNQFYAVEFTSLPAASGPQSAAFKLRRF